MKLAKTLPALAAAFLAAAALARAYTLDAFTFAGGSGMASGGAYALSGTVGQTEAYHAPMSGGSFTLIGGFWAGETEDAGPPQLRITPLADAVRLHWRWPAAGFVLEQSGGLGDVWTPVTLPRLTNAAEISVTVPAAAAQTFFRLTRP